MISIGQLFTITYGSKQYHNKEFLKKIPGPTPYSMTHTCSIRYTAL